MARHKQTKEDLAQHLREHVDWLEESMASFDSGKEHSAKRLAHTMRTLLHDTTKSHSLLGQLAVKESLRYWSVLPDFGSEEASEFVGVPMTFVFEGGKHTLKYLPISGRHNSEFHSRSGGRMSRSL
jgi:hypothetical protein